MRFEKRIQVSDKMESLADDRCSTKVGDHTGPP